MLNRFSVITVGGVKRSCFRKRRFDAVVHRYDKVYPVQSNVGNKYLRRKFPGDVLERLLGDNAAGGVDYNRKRVAVSRPAANPKHRRPGKTKREVSSFKFYLRGN